MIETVDNASSFHQRFYRLRVVLLLVLVVAQLFNMSSKGDFGRTTLSISYIKKRSDPVVHLEAAERLPFLPFELLSARERTCSPPNEIPKLCCIGSSSGGGTISYNPASCLNHMSSYEKVREKALAFLANHPVHGETKCDLCAIVGLLLQHNLTLDIHGDSLTSQSFNGLHCELLRRGYFVEFDEVIHPTAARWRYGYRATQTLRVGSPSRPATIMFHFMYRPFLDMQEVVNVTRDSDIIVFDHGLHYGPPEADEFVEAMSGLLRSFRDKRLVAWRETSSQHFNATGGYWTETADQINCFPISGAFDRHRPWIEDAAELANYTLQDVTPNFGAIPIASDELVVLPFREFTQDLYDLHDGECTHFCSTPDVWLPIWRSLRLAMERVLL